MRYLLLIACFAWQAFGHGANPIDLQKSNAEKELTSIKSSSKERSYKQFRYYSPDTGTYISQDPIGLAGGMPNMYAYVHDSNSYIDVLGLNPIVVIGENQAAVNEATKKLRAAGYNAESMQVPKNQWKFPDPLNSSNIGDAAEWNKGWMIDKINKGYDVVDIGLDPYRDVSKGRSPFYAKELEALKETKGAGKRIKLKKFPDGESVAGMRKRLNYH